MTETAIKFTDGAAYENYMGKWSQKVGDAFLDWLAPPNGKDWIDVGCGNGAFTETILKRVSPKSIMGIDPSESQLSFARARFSSSLIEFRQADAMAQPFADDSFDVAVMPLVIFFVPDPMKGVAEMKRVVRSGGYVTAYGWDLTGGGFPYQLIQEEMRALGAAIGMPPRREAAEIASLNKYWIENGLVQVETNVITVERVYPNFDNYWTTVLTGPSLGPGLSKLSGEDSTRLQSKLKMLLKPTEDGKIVCRARAHAVKGRVKK